MPAINYWNPASRKQDNGQNQSKPASSNYNPPIGSPVVSHYTVAGSDKSGLMASVPQLEEFKKKLGFIDKINVNRETRQQIRERYSSVIGAMLDSQVEIIRFQLGVSTSDTKKTILKNSLEASAQIDAEIKAISTEFDKDMLVTEIDSALDMLEMKASQIRQLNALMTRNQDVLTGRDYTAHRSEIDEAEEQFRANLKGKTALFMINHAEKIQRALTMLQERNFGGHPL
jgi:hypothetical protein